MNSVRITRWFIYLLIGVAIVAILWSYNSTGTSTEELAISNLAQQIKDGDVAEQITGMVAKSKLEETLNNIV